MKIVGNGSVFLERHARLVAGAFFMAVGVVSLSVAPLLVVPCMALGGGAIVFDFWLTVERRTGLTPKGSG